MDVKIGQQVFAPNPDGGEGMISATVIDFGEPSHGVELMVEGRPVLRDVAILRYDEGGWEGLLGRCRYDLLRPIEESTSG